MKFCVVNEKDEIMGYKEKKDFTDTDIQRVSAIWLYNSKNEILIAQRAFNKLYDPGKWSVSAAGTVEEGETYLSNIIKETEEELGIKLKEQDLVTGKHNYNNSAHKYFSQSYLAKVDLSIEQFHIQKDEVENIQWITLAEAQNILETSPDFFTASFSRHFEYLTDFFKN